MKHTPILLALLAGLAASAVAGSILTPSQDETPQVVQEKKTDEKKTKDSKKKEEAEKITVWILDATGSG